MMEYKGYFGSASFDEDDRLFYGRLAFIRALVSYEATDADGLVAAFREAVDDYLAQCAEHAEEPERPFKGTFNVRVGEALHRAAALAATDRHISLNQFVAEAIDAATQAPKPVARRGARTRRQMAPP